MTPTDPLPPGRHAERLTEQRNPRTRHIDRLPTAEALALMQAEDRRCFEAAEAVAQDIARAVERVSAAFAAGGRLFYVGAGTSGRLGVLDASEQPPTFGVPPEMVQGIIAGGPEALTRSIEGAEDDPGRGGADLDSRGVGPADVVAGITSGGRAPYVLGALRRAREIGAGTILLSCTPPLEGETDFADIQIHALTGPEVVTGSTRLKAGTVTKLILNQITTLSMIRHGKVYENLMVDLRPVNEKLRDRAARIMYELTGLERHEALGKLDAAGNDLKVALVMTLAGCDLERAKRTLEEHSGHVARALSGLRGR